MSVPDVVVASRDLSPHGCCCYCTRARIAQVRPGRHDDKRPSFVRGITPAAEGPPPAVGRLLAPYGELRGREGSHAVEVRPPAVELPPFDGTVQWAETKKPERTDGVHAHGERRGYRR